MKPDEINLPFLQQAPMPLSLETGHKHSGHEAIMSGGANACPICQAFKIQGLQSLLASYQFQDGQHSRVLQEVIQHLKAWRDDGMAAINIATNSEVKSAIGDRIIAYRGAEKLLMDMLKEILKRTDDAHAKTVGGVKDQNKNA